MSWVVGVKEPMVNTTETALLRRGVDENTAKRLVSEGHTISKLNTLNISSLESLGLTNEQINIIRDKTRPPIPKATVNKLLYKCAYTCAVCREKTHPIIIHHLIEWSKTRNHNEDNLIVLCLACHSKAHSINTISMNLTIDKLKAFKDKWEAKVRKSESDALFTKTSWWILGAVWDYFNHNRIVDTAGRLGVDVKSANNYQNLVRAGTISNDGSYIWPSNVPLTCKNSISYIYDNSLLGFDRSLCNFYSSLIKLMLEQTEWLDVSTIFKRSTAQLIESYPIIVVTGSFRFNNIRKKHTGPGQTINGYKTARGLKVEFSIDAWETTSQSAHSVNLSGVWRSTCILLVRSVSRSEKLSTVHCTCLAIGTGFTEFVSTTPAIAYRDESEDEEDDEYA